MTITVTLVYESEAEMLADLAAVSVDRIASIDGLQPKGEGMKTSPRARADHEHRPAH